MQLAALRDSHQAGSGCKGTAEPCLGVRGWAATAQPWVDETMVGRVCPHCTLTAGPAGTGRNSVLISIEVLKGMKCGLAEMR